MSWPKRNEYFRMSGTYIPPRKDAEKTSEAFYIVSDALAFCRKKHSPVVLVGNINVDNLKNSKKSTEFNELLAEYDIMRVSLQQEFTP